MFPTTALYQGGLRFRYPDHFLSIISYSQNKHLMTNAGNTLTSVVPVLTTGTVKSTLKYGVAPTTPSSGQAVHPSWQYRQAKHLCQQAKCCCQQLRYFCR